MSLLKHIITTLIFAAIIIKNVHALENKILFKVNNEIITSLDIFYELEYLKSINAEIKKINKTEAFEISKNSLIKDKIKVIELKKVVKEIKVENDLLNNFLINSFQDLDIKSVLEFENYFKSKGLDPNKIKKKIEIEIIWNQYIYSKFNQTVKIDIASIKKNLLTAKKQKEYLVAEILFNIDNNEKLDEKFKLIKDSIKNNSFSQAALKYSISDTSKQGGKLGWIKEASLNDEINNKIQDLKIGEYSNPIVLPGGFLILKILDIKESDVELDTEKELNRIVARQTNEQLNRLSNIYYNKVKKDIQINEL